MQRHLLAFGLTLVFLALPHATRAAACHDEANRLADRHALATEQTPDDARAPTADSRAQASALLDAARKADDDGLVEQCLRRLAQARDLIESAPPPPRSPPH